MFVNVPLQIPQPGRVISKPSVLCTEFIKASCFILRCRLHYILLYSIFCPILYPYWIDRRYPCLFQWRIYTWNWVGLEKDTSFVGRGASSFHPSFSHRTIPTPSPFPHSSPTIREETEKSISGTAPAIVLLQWVLGFFNFLVCLPVNRRDSNVPLWTSQFDPAGLRLCDSRVQCAHKWCHPRCGIRARLLWVRMGREAPYPDVMFWAPWSWEEAELLVGTKKLGIK